MGALTSQDTERAMAAVVVVSLEVKNEKQLPIFFINICYFEAV